MKWKAVMPRELPEDGTSHIVVSIKNSDGGRIEYSGKVDSKLAADILFQMPPLQEVNNDDSE